MIWNPWRGCHKVSDGCKYCYIHKGDIKRNMDTNQIVKTKDFYKPIEKKKDGSYKIASGTLVYVCFNSDFLIEEADPWRMEAYEMMKERQDLHFLFLTKRIERFYEVLPSDDRESLGNLTIGVSVENQVQADIRLSIFNKIPIKHKNIICQPMIGPINLDSYLDGVELVVVGGEQDKNARVLNYDWVLEIRESCIKKNVSFSFRQCGTHFIKDGISYQIPTNMLMKQARKASIDFTQRDILDDFLETLDQDLFVE